MQEIAEYNSKDNNKLKETCFLLPHLYSERNKNKNINNNNQNSFFNRYMGLTKKNKNSNHEYNYYLDSVFNNSKGNIINKTISSPINYDKIEFTHKIFNFDEDEKINNTMTAIPSRTDDIENEIYKDLTKLNNPDLIIKKEKEPHYEEEKMKTIKNLAFKNRDRKYFNFVQKLKEKYDKGEFEYNDEDDEEYTINGMKINDVAKNVLNNCKVNLKKSKFNKGNLKALNGKTMITQGMTVKDFYHKYGVGI